MERDSDIARLPKSLRPAFSVHLLGQFLPDGAESASMLNEIPVRLGRREQATANGREDWLAEQSLSFEIANLL